MKIRGASVTRLKLYRSFYRIFPIGPTVSDQSEPHFPKPPGKSPTASDILTIDALRIQPTLSAELLNRFSLGWSHYVELLTIDSPDERRFYEIEAAANQWSVRELQRQIASSLYQRLALSRDKEEIRRLAADDAMVTLEETPDLTSEWTPAGLQASHILHDDGTATVVHVPSESAGSATRRFWRLRVQLR